MSTITRGVLIFVVLSCMQGCLDIFAKIAVGHAPATLTNFYRYALLFICCLFWAFLRGSFLRLVAQTFTAPFLIARGLCQGVFGAAYFLSLSLLPLSIASSLFFTFPLFLILISIVFLREKVHCSQWAFCLLGFTGMSLIMKPGGNASPEGLFFAMLAVAAFAFFQLITRMISQKYDFLSMMFSTMFYAVAAALGVLLREGINPLLEIPHAGEYWLALLLFVSFAFMGNLLLITAFKYAPASMLAPLSYVRLGVCVLASHVFFQERIDPAAWCGIVVILCSGTGQSLFSLFLDKKR